MAKEQQKQPPVQSKKRTAPSVPQVKKPGRLSTVIARIDWLFVIGMICVLVVSAFLMLIEREKQAFRSLQQQESDQLQVVYEQTAVSPNDVAILNKAFLDENGVVDFIQRLERTASYFETFELSFESDIAEGETLKYLPFTVSMSGSYENVSLFVDTLLTAQYVIELKEYHLASTDGFRKQATLRLSGNVYVAE